MENRQPDMIDQRRPGEFEAVGNSDEREQADRRLIDADLG
jgi:hypothetical protein